MNSKVQFVKRGMDIVGSLIGLVLGAPLFALVAAAIKLDDNGPILYKQTRAGTLMDPISDASDVHTFTMLKFRTMRIDAEANQDRPIRAVVNDPRVTTVGRILRRSRLDELPQLFNVLIGEMSLVGPRPERPETIHDLAAAIPFFEERMRVKPGITGLAQVNLDYMGYMDDTHVMAHLRRWLTNPFQLNYAGTSEADDMRTKILFDFTYSVMLEKMSTFLLTDLGIILRTPPVMLLGKGR